MDAPGPSTGSAFLPEDRPHAATKNDLKMCRGATAPDWSLKARKQDWFRGFGNSIFLSSPVSYLIPHSESSGRTQQLSLQAFAGQYTRSASLCFLRAN